MTIALDAVNMRLLGDWQRNFPLVSNPFAEIGHAIGCTEADVVDRLTRLSTAGAVSRIGATIRPNTAGASTLAAVAAPVWRVDEVAELIGAEPGVNHSYLRENDWNIWFVATGPDRAHVDATLARIGAATGLTVLDLPLVRPYNIDLGFALEGPVHAPAATPDADCSVLQEGDREALQALTRGLPIVARPFAALADKLARPERDVLQRIGVLCGARIISRLGIILRHRALGWRSNAMVVWRMPEADADRAGVVLAAQPGVTLCYQRRPDSRYWPFNLFCMIHARSRDEALSTLNRAEAAAGLEGAERQILFSVRCFKQTGAMVMNGREVAA